MRVQLHRGPSVWESTRLVVTTLPGSPKRLTDLTGVGVAAARLLGLVVERGAWLCQRAGAWSGASSGSCG